MKTTFTTTQFIVILAVNLIFLMLVGAHYFNETVRVVHDTQTVTNTVVKQQTVQKCDAVEKQMDLMQKADNICQDNSSNRIRNFHIDSAGNPVFDCN